MTPPLDNDRIVRSIAAERRRTLDLLRQIEPDRWDSPALPRWRIREVVAHLIATDSAAVTGRFLPLAFKKSTDPLEAWNDRQVPKWADRPPAQMLDALERWGRRFLFLARALRPTYRLHLPTSSWGREPLGMVIWIRAYDEWIHRQDIRRALGMTDDAVQVSDVAEFLLRAIGYAMPLWPTGPGGVVAVSLRGLPLSEWGFTAGSSRSGPALATEATARIEALGPAFLMAAADRDSFGDLRSTGDLVVTGDEALADWFLANARIV